MNKDIARGRRGPDNVQRRGKTTRSLPRRRQTTRAASVTETELVSTATVHGVSETDKPNRNANPWSPETDGRLYVHHYVVLLDISQESSFPPKWLSLFVGFFCVSLVDNI